MTAPLDTRKWGIMFFAIERIQASAYSPVTLGFAVNLLRNSFDFNGKIKDSAYNFQNCVQYSGNSSSGISSSAIRPLSI